MYSRLYLNEAFYHARGIPGGRKGRSIGPGPVSPLARRSGCTAEPVGAGQPRRRAGRKGSI